MQKKRVPVFLVIIAFSISAVRLFGTLHDFGIGAAGNGLPDYCRREALKIASGRSCARYSDTHMIVLDGTEDTQVTENALPRTGLFKDADGKDSYENFPKWMDYREGMERLDCRPRSHIIRKRTICRKKEFLFPRLEGIYLYYGKKQ